MILKPSDLKLLSVLYHNCRDSYTRLAKLSGLSREQVQYKIKNYLKTGIIRKFVPIINYPALGYNYFVSIFIKFNNLEEYTALQKSLDIKHTIGYGHVLTKYDLFITMIFKNEQEFSKYMVNIRNADYFIINHIDAELYPLKFFESKSRDMRMVRQDDEVITLDESQKKILRLLVKDARMRIVDIANSVGISSELTLYKLRQLEKKVIAGYRIQFNMSRLGYYFTTLLVQLDAAYHLKLREYCRNSKNIISLSTILNRPNCVIQLFHKDEESYRKILFDIKRLFDNPYIEAISTTEELMDMNTVPFIL